MVWVAEPCLLQQFWLVGWGLMVAAKGALVSGPCLRGVTSPSPRLGASQGCTYAIPWPPRATGYTLLCPLAVSMARVVVMWFL